MVSKHVHLTALYLQLAHLGGDTPDLALGQVEFSGQLDGVVAGELGPHLQVYHHLLQALALGQVYLQAAKGTTDLGQQDQR